MWNIIDFEASSLSLSKSYPIQVGVYFADSDTIYKDYIIPAVSSWTDWNENSEKIHNIPRQRLFEEGKSAVEVATKLNNLLNDSVVYCDGGEYDQWWLQRLFEAASTLTGSTIKPSFEMKDVTDIKFNGVQMVMPPMFYKIRDDIIESHGFNLHDAGDDAKMIHSILKELHHLHEQAHRGEL